jgi:hypothetical protein
MNESEPLMKCRENAQSVETTGLLVPEEKSVVRYLIAGYMADGIKVA